MPVTVPNLLGAGRTAAEATLDSLLLRHIARFPFAADANGVAVSQSPAAGTVIPKYTVVTIDYPSPLGPLDDSPIEGPAPVRSTGPRTNGIPWLMTAGRQIIAADSGAPVLLRGVNNLHSEWIGATGDISWEQQAIPRLAATWKGNIWCRGFAADPVNSNDATYLGILDGYQALCAANRMYLHLPFRSYAVNGDQPVSADNRALAALEKLAARYKGKSNVIYGLQVEPHDVDWTTLRPLFEAMIDAIRAAAAPDIPLVMVPGTNWSRNLGPAVADPVNRDDIVMKSHPYDPAANFQAEFGVAHDAGWPVFIGEFGPFDPMTMSDVATLLDFARTRAIGWAAWSFDYDDPNILHKLVDAALAPTTPYGVAVQAEMATTPALP
jgi:hypothetical protein